MSYFCCGCISWTDGTEIEAAAWGMVRAGHAKNLNIICGPNITQKDVRDMLAERAQDAMYKTDFLLTGGPLEDTSDSLISPDNGVDGVLSGLARVESWIQMIAGTLHPIEIRILMTEGYDDQFVRVELGDSGLCSALAPKLREQEDVPSMEFIIRAAW